MRIVTETRQIYQYAELTTTAKEYAHQQHIQNIDYEWWDFIYENIKQAGIIMGIEISRIYFSGFSNQGDGACFDGFYKYAKGSSKKIREEFPEILELHRIADNLSALQRSYFYSLQARIKHSGHYYHKYCTIIDVDDANDREISDYVQKSIEDNLRDFMEQIYQWLAEEYDYLISEENFIESANDNELEFTSDGNLYFHIGENHG